MQVIKCNYNTCRISGFHSNEDSYCGISDNLDKCTAFMSGKRLLGNPEGKRPVGR
jgi:hypothetical protein